MHEKYVEILKCPKSNSDLFLKHCEKDNRGMIKSGELASADGQTIYPIINYIPRFVDSEMYSSSFGFEWTKWQRTQFESENSSTVMAGVTENMFYKITSFKGEDFKNKVILDYGCGSGRFIDLVYKGSAVTVGLDMSSSVENAWENFKDKRNVLIVQGDVLNPPFKDGIFDTAYSIGVLHHTPNPGKAFSKMSQLVKNGGKASCCVYPDDSFYSFFSVKIYRKIIFILSMFNKKFSRKMALFYSSFSAKILFSVKRFLHNIPVLGRFINYIFERYFFVVVDLEDENWRFLDTFDAITPRYASTHSAQEVKVWFQNNSFDNIKTTDWCKTSLVGIKK